MSIDYTRYQSETINGRTQIYYYCEQPYSGLPYAMQLFTYMREAAAELQGDLSDYAIILITDLSVKAATLPLLLLSTLELVIYAAQSVLFRDKRSKWNAIASSVALLHMGVHLLKLPEKSYRISVQLDNLYHETIINTLHVAPFSRHIFKEIFIIECADFRERLTKKNLHPSNEEWEAGLRLVTEHSFWEAALFEIPPVLILSKIVCVALSIFGVKLLSISLICLQSAILYLNPLPFGKRFALNTTLPALTFLRALQNDQIPSRPETVHYWKEIAQELLTHNLFRGLGWPGYLLSRVNFPRPPPPKINIQLIRQCIPMIQEAKRLIKNCPHPYMTKEEREDLLEDQIKCFAFIDFMLINELYNNGASSLLILENLFDDDDEEPREINPENEKMALRLQRLTPIQRALLEQRVVQMQDFTEPLLNGINSSVLQPLIEIANSFAPGTRKLISENLLKEGSSYLDTSSLTQEEVEVLALLIHPNDLTDLVNYLGNVRDPISTNELFISALTRVILFK